MFVFRVEDNKGFGPYFSDDEGAADIFCFHKNPEMQGITIPSKNYFFSWKTLKILKQHLTEEKKFLHNSHIWKISVYDISEKYCIVCPDNQVAFLKKHAILIERLNFRNINMIRRYQ